MWTPTISSDELYHYGILGMKWGVRRYQNPDGSYTAAGRDRYGISGKSKNKNKNPTVQVLNNVRNTTNPASDIVTRVSNIKKVHDYKEPKELKRMSDDELRRKINRLDMERRYTQLTNDNTTKGEKYVKEALGIIGDVAAIGVSVALIANLFKHGLSGGILQKFKDKKAKKQENAKRLNDMRDIARKGEDDFEATKEGKKLRKAHDDAWDKMVDYDGDDRTTEDRLVNDFAQKEEKFLRASERARAYAIIKEYGKEGLMWYINNELDSYKRPSVPNSKLTDDLSIEELVKLYEDANWEAHRA